MPTFITKILGQSVLLRLLLSSEALRRKLPFYSQSTLCFTVKTHNTSICPKTVLFSIEDCPGKA